jgi:flagellar biosynthesis anti-sigma factor FlgM
MAMRVSDSISFPENKDITSKVGGVDTPKVKGQSESPSFTQDETDLSANLQKVQELKTHLANLPDVRLERVQVLQNAISNGTYEVDAGKIADAMMNDLAGKQQGS